MGRRRSDGEVDGVLVVDKPAGMTSHDVVAVVRRAAGTRKVGHTGTLDPDATGVLVCCLGRATRLVRFLQAGRKTYAARMVLGRETTTQDAAGEVVAEVDASHVTEQELCLAMTRFQGEIEQVPPMVSALKVDGERLHAKARRGEVVEREPRRVTVHDLVLEDWVPGSHPEAAFLVTCSAGTYVRTLAHDLGRELGVGGSLTSLRRLANGAFTTDQAVALDDVRRLGDEGRLGDVLLPLVDATRGMPRVEVDDPGTVLALTHGKTVPARGVDGVYAVTSGDRLVGVFRDEDGRTRAEAVLLRPEEVAPPVGLASSAADGAPSVPAGTDEVPPADDPPRDPEEHP
jgi:tRNA pseudouridine55 synthase